MAKKIRVSQEQEIIKTLKKEGFRKLSKKDIGKEPCKSIYKMPDCFKESK